MIKFVVQNATTCFAVVVYHITKICLASFGPNGVKLASLHLTKIEIYFTKTKPMVQEKTLRPG